MVVVLAIILAILKIEPVKIKLEETVKLAAFAIVPPRNAVAATNVDPPKIPETNPLPVVNAPFTAVLVVTVTDASLSTKVLANSTKSVKVSVAMLIGVRDSEIFSSLYYFLASINSNTKTLSWSNSLLIWDISRSRDLNCFERSRMLILVNNASSSLFITRIELDFFKYISY